MVYTVKKGEHDFTPNFFPSFYFGKRMDFNVKFHENCWWSKEDPDYFGADDIYDWNKLYGMTHYFSLNNVNSMLLGWRPAKKFNIIEVCSYVNFTKKKSREVGKTFGTGPIYQIPVNVNFYCKIHWSGKEVGFHYGDKFSKYKQRRPLFVRRVGSWFGGNQEAHKEMELELNKVF